jgi:hypothetical protein
MVGVVRRACSDTVKQAGGPGGIAFLLFGTLAGWISLRPVAGAAAMTAAVPSLVAGLVGFGVTALMILIGNLATAPFHLERERRSACEATLAETKAQLERQAEATTRRPNLIGVSRGIIHGAPDPEIANLKQLWINLEIVNTGNMPSAIPTGSWKISLVEENGGEEYITIVSHGPVTVWDASGVGRIFHPSKAIYTLGSATPIEIGGMIEGFLYTRLTGDQHDKVRIGNRLHVRYADVTGRTYLVEHVISVPSVGRMPYIPFAPLEGLADDG